MKGLDSLLGNVMQPSVDLPHREGVVDGHPNLLELV